MTNPIPEVKLVPVPKDPDGKAMKFFMAPEYLGHRHKIGGTPDLLQKKAPVICPYCTEEMDFYAQLDAVSDEHPIGDCGLIYVYYCFDCNCAQAVVSSN